MLTTSIGETLDGKKIKILSFFDHDSKMEQFAGYSERDLFDAIMVVEYVLLREMRKVVPDNDWMDSLRRHRRFMRRALGAERFACIRENLGILTAFAARDYGRSLAYRHFKD